MEMTDATKWCAGALPGGAPAHQEHENSLKALAAKALRDSDRAPASHHPESSDAPDQRCDGASGASGASGAEVVPASSHHPMTVFEVLLIAWAAGLVLERRGDQMIVHGLKPEAPAELLQVLRDHKAELLGLYPCPSPIHPPQRTA
jgi:hypothetical protein